jgi:hypothetical protein
MSNILNELIKMTNEYSNFRQTDNKYLIVMDFLLFAVITLLGQVGAIGSSLDFTIDHNLKQIFWSAYGVAMSYAIRWLVKELYKKYSAYKKSRK